MENIDWMWTLSGVTWMVGGAAGIRLTVLNPGTADILSGLAGFFLALIGLGFFQVGIGIAYTNSEPWEHVELVFMIGNLIAAFFIWRVVRRYF